MLINSRVFRNRGFEMGKSSETLIEDGINNPIYQIVGENIQKIRKAKGLNQNDLAVLTGYCRLTIIHFENAKSQRISIAALDTIANALGVPISVFFSSDSSSEVKYWKDEYIVTERNRLAIKVKVNELLKILQE
jgi:transcriptional regulator with XRE-family HTH domain